MKKRKLLIMFSLMLTLLLIGCGGNKHKAKSDWMSDENNHWHECSSKGHDDKIDEAKHTWNEGIITVDPTEEKEGVKTFTCTVCERTKTEPVNKLSHTHTFDTTTWEKDEDSHWHKANCEHTELKIDEAKHTFGEWTVKQYEGIHHDRIEERKCSVCGFIEEKVFTGTATHDYAETWSSDENNHWFECSCGRKEDVAEHAYGNWSEKTPAGVDQDKVISRECSECGYEEIKTCYDSKTNGNYRMVIIEVIKVDGIKHVKVKVVKGNVSVGDNVGIDGIEGTFTIDKILNNFKEVTSASYGEEVTLVLEGEDGNLDDVTNKLGGYLIYEPDTKTLYNSFTAAVYINEKSEGGKNTPTFNNEELLMNIFGEDIRTLAVIVKIGEEIPNGLAMPGNHYILTFTLRENINPSLWEGLDFECALLSDKSVITVVGTIISLNN